MPHEASIMKKPFVSIVIPAYNEAAILERSLKIFQHYMQGLEDRYDWEIVIVNDGSRDATGKLADAFALEHSNFTVVHHRINRNLGGALKTGFAHARGEYIVSMDLDLSYSPDHIEKLLTTIIETGADVVIASPYMKGGRVTNVPFMREALSKMVNRYMSYTSQDRFYTFTCMVRAYNAEFLHSLNLKGRGYEVNPEIIYKALILRAHIVEVPAHLDWSFQNTEGKTRISGLRVIQGIFSGLMSGFIFRPYVFFLAIGIVLLLLAAYIGVWILINTLALYPAIPHGSYFDDQFSLAIAELFKRRPHAFLVGGFTLVVALQFLSMGFLSLQNKRYFEELFHINTTVFKQLRSK
jgi:dolichol-phosphate mannosyltransferase